MRQWKHNCVKKTPTYYGWNGLWCCILSNKLDFRSTVGRQIFPLRVIFPHKTAHTTYFDTPVKRHWSFHWIGLIMWHNHFRQLHHRLIEILSPGETNQRQQWWNNQSSHCTIKNINHCNLFIPLSSSGIWPK